MLSHKELHELIFNRAVQIEAAYKACPSTKLVASGYSQGGQIVHNAIGLLPATVASWSTFILASCTLSHGPSPLQHPFADLETLTFLSQQSRHLW